MKQVHASVEFERLAFVSAIREHPGERAHQLAFVDWMHEICGYTIIGAKRLVTKIVREATDEWLQIRVASWLMSNDTNAMTVRHRIRFYFVGRCDSNCEIVVMANGDKPFTIDRFTRFTKPDEVVSTEFNSGRDWSVVRYATGVTRSVGVGVRWVMRLCESADIHIPTLRESGGPYS